MSCRCIFYAVFICLSLQRKGQASGDDITIVDRELSKSSFTAISSSWLTFGRSVIKSFASGQPCQVRAFWVLMTCRMAIVFSNSDKNPCLGLVLTAEFSPQFSRILNFQINSKLSIKTPPPRSSKLHLLFAYWLRSSVVSVFFSLITETLGIPKFYDYSSFWKASNHLWLATWFGTDGFCTTLPQSAVDSWIFKDRDLCLFWNHLVLLCP